VKCNWSGLDEAPSGTHEYYRGALRHINGDSPFTQPPLKVIEIGLLIADKQRRLARPGYDGRVVRVNFGLKGGLFLCGFVLASVLCHRVAGVVG